VAKILLVDTNFSSTPIWEWLNAQGHEVHVVGGNPSDSLAKWAPRFWHLDYSNANALSSLLDSEQFDFLVPGCNDVSYSVCAQLASGRYPGLDTPTTTDALNNKAQFRALAERIGLPTPRTFPDPASIHSGPVIVKPVDSFSGKGVTVVQHGDSVEFGHATRVAREASSSGECIVEEFVEGQLYSHSAFISGGDVRQDFIVQEDGTAHRFSVDTSRVEFAAPTRLVNQLRSCAKKLAHELQLVDGLLHIQFIENAGRIWLIEATRRCPGDLYSQLIELATGFPYAENYARPFIGRTFSDARPARKRQIIRHTISMDSAKIFSSMQFLGRPHIERLVPIRCAGDPLRPGSIGRIAILFCRTGTKAECDKLYAAFLNRSLYVVADVQAPSRTPD
jgi:hypothetical protein